MSTMTLTELLTGFEVEKQLEREQRPHAGLTASVFGGCLRRIGLKVHGVAETDQQPAVTVATVGSLLHIGTAMLWAKLGYDVEVTAEHGTLDAIHQKRKEVRDLKSVTRSRFDWWASNNGPPIGVWKQAHIYGHDHGADESWTILVDVLCRESGRTATYQMVYDPSLAAEALRDLEVGDETIAAGVPEIPDERYGPGDPVCDNCPFFTHCWGEQAEHPVFSDEDIEKFGLEYLAAAAAEKEAKDVKARIKARLHGAKGPYGDVEIKWSPVKASTYTVEKKAGKQLRVGRRAK